MEITKLIAIVSILITLGMASERLVEIIKGFIPTLNEARTDAKEEAKRKAKIAILAVGCGIFTAFLASPIIAGIFGDIFKASTCGPLKLVNLGYEGSCVFELNAAGIFVVIALGLLASVGSAFWNSILEYLLKIKDLKKAEIAHTKAMQETETVKARALDIEANSMLARDSRPETE